MRVNIYLNDDDYKLWQELENKSAWVAEKLNEQD